LRSIPEPEKYKDPLAGAVKERSTGYHSTQRTRGRRICSSSRHLAAAIRERGLKSGHTKVKFKHVPPTGPEKP